MTTEEIIRYILSFLGGGFVVAVGNWVTAAWSSRKQQEIIEIRDQVRSLYGPLHFFCSQNKRLVELSGTIHDAYKREFIDKRWSSEATTQERLKGQEETTIDLSNAYIARVLKNNEHVMHIMETQWHLLEPDDVDVFSEFQIDYVRHQEEYGERGSLRTPDAIYKALGHVALVRPKLIDHVESKFNQKRTRLFVLTTPWLRR